MNILSILESPEIILLLLKRDMGKNGIFSILSIFSVFILIESQNDL